MCGGWPVSAMTPQSSARRVRRSTLFCVPWMTNWTESRPSPRREGAVVSVQELLLVKTRELLAKMIDLGRVIERNVGIIRMQGGVVLVIALGGIKSLQSRHLGDDRPGEKFGLLQLGDVGLGDAFLFAVAVENCGTILAAGVRALPVELGWIVRNREKNLKELAIRNLRGVVSDLDRLGMAGFACAHEFVMGSGGRASGVAGSGGLDTFDVLKDGLDSPETASGEHSSLVASGCTRGVDGGIGKTGGVGGLRTVPREGCGQGCNGSDDSEFANGRVLGNEIHRDLRAVGWIPGVARSCRLSAGRGRSRRDELEGHYKIAVSRIVRPSAKRAKSKRRESMSSVFPLRIRSERILPVAGACITPWPLKPFARKKPGTSGTSPRIGWWSGVIS